MYIVEDTLGSIIKDARLKKELTREQLVQGISLYSSQWFQKLIGRLKPEMPSRVRLRP